MTAPLRSLDPSAVTLWRIEELTRSVFLVAIPIVALMAVGAPVPLWILIAGGLVVIAGVVALVPPLRYRAWGFAIGEEHVRMRYGVLFRTTSIVPHARIQHVDTRHGPIDRWFGLASLVIYTAGTRGAVVTIPALAGAEAEELRDHLAALSGAGDAV